MDVQLRLTILETADVMGLSRESEAVKTALETAELALSEQYGPEIAMDLAREALRSAVPAA